MTNADELAKQLLGKLSGETEAPVVDESAKMVSPTLNIEIPELDDETEIETFKLSDDPTDEELRKYAKTLPSVRHALKIFRANIVNVSLINDPKK